MSIKKNKVLLEGTSKAGFGGIVTKTLTKKAHPSNLKDNIFQA
jgi:dihydroorotate dehydrogenase